MCVCVCIGMYCILYTECALCIIYCSWWRYMVSKKSGCLCVWQLYGDQRVCVYAYNILMAVYGVPKEWVCVCIYTGGSIRCPKTVCVYANTLVAVYGDHPPVPPPPSSPLTRPDRPLPSTSCFPGHSLRAPPNDHSTAGSCTNSCWGQNFGTKVTLSAAPNNDTAGDSLLPLQKLLLMLMLLLLLLPQLQEQQFLPFASLLLLWPSRLSHHKVWGYQHQCTAQCGYPPIKVENSKALAGSRETRLIWSKQSQPPSIWYEGKLKRPQPHFQLNTCLQQKSEVAGVWCWSPLSTKAPPVAVPHPRFPQYPKSPRVSPAGCRHPPNPPLHCTPPPLSPLLNSPISSQYLSPLHKSTKQLRWKNTIKKRERWGREWYKWERCRSWFISRKRK